MTWDSEIEVPPNIENLLMMSGMHDAYVVKTEGDPLNRTRVRVVALTFGAKGKRIGRTGLMWPEHLLGPGNSRVTPVFIGPVYQDKESWWVIPVQTH